MKVEINSNNIADFIMFASRSFLLDQSKRLNQANVSYAQWFLLGFLSSEDYLTMTDISKKMGHSTAAATGLVDRLEKLGYVSRLHAVDDRRKVMVQITRKGIDFVDGMRKHVVGDVSELLGKTSEGEEVVGVHSGIKDFLSQ